MRSENFGEPPQQFQRILIYIIVFIKMAATAGILCFQTKPYLCKGQNMVHGLQSSIPQ